MIRRGRQRVRQTRYIAWTALPLMTVGSVGYSGSAPTMSVFGRASVFLYVLPAPGFLVPVSLVAARATPAHRN